MSPKILLIPFLALSFIVIACQPAAIPSSSNELPTPVVETDSASSGYQQVIVVDLAAEVGVGSPIPVHVNVSGDLPDTCAQIEYTEVKQDGTNFIIELSAIPSNADGCIQDTLPFRMSIPLNVIGLPAGDYSVTVNGSRADFRLESGNSTSSPPTADPPIVKDDIQVDDVTIEVGVGSPIPVKAVVSGNLPNACAHLGEVRLHRDETTFFVQLLAYLPEQTECTPDVIPFRLEIPLNIVNLPNGTYEIIVNGETANFTLPIK